MEAFRFTDADLQVNRTGRMSGEQHYWFVDRLLRHIFICAGLVAVATWFLVDSFNHQWPFFGSEGVWLARIIAGIDFIYCIYFAVYSLLNVLVGLIVRTVVSAYAKGHVCRRGRSIYDRLDIVNDVDKLRFERPKRVFRTIVNNEYYTVYYAPRSKIILALEIS
jgi:hypothetical protein